MKIAKSLLVIIVLAFTALVTTAQDKDIRDISGTWIGWENGNKMILELKQNGTQVTGTLRFPDIQGRAPDRITGTVSPSIERWDVMKFVWTRSREPTHKYIGYTMTHGTRKGKAMSGYCHSSSSGIGPEGNFGWFAER